MQKSESIKNIAAALVQFHDIVEPITKDSDNPYFKSKYASLDHIIEATSAYLTTTGLTFAQFPDGLNGLTTILMHKDSGEWLESRYEIPLAKNDPQGAGSALTYMRRYALGAILGLATEEDDDANSESKPAVKKTNIVERNDQPFSSDPKNDEPFKDTYPPSQGPTAFDDEVKKDIDSINW